MDVVSILQIGVVGLGFLLAYLAYKLLGSEQTRNPPRTPILVGIYVFMFFSVCLVVLGGTFKALPDILNYFNNGVTSQNEITFLTNELKQKRTDNDGLIIKLENHKNKIKLLEESRCEPEQCIKSDGTCGLVHLDAGAIYANKSPATASNACCGITNENIAADRWEASDSHTSPTYGGGLPGLKVRVRWHCL